MPWLEVLRAFVASVQDLGRPGYRALGVPVCGALDRAAAAYANALVGNPLREAVIEAVGGGLEFRVVGGDAVLAVTGAEAEVRVDGEAAPLWQPFRVGEGSVVSVSRPKAGLAVYVGVSGGIAVKEVLGSKSTYARAGFGGLEGRMLKRGDKVPVGCVDVDAVWEVVKGRSAPEWVRSRVPSGTATLRVTKGVHYGRAPEGFKELLEGPFAVSPQSDRMGFRLEGRVVEAVKGLGRLPSSPTDRGYVQVPPNGRPIVLMSDSQTTGGYAVLAHVIMPDVDVLAQCVPGQEVRFVEVGVREAERETIRYLNMLEQAVVTVVVEEEYWGEFLPSGVVEGIRKGLRGG